MTKINYQALREKAEKATKGSYIVGHTSVNQHGNLTGVFVCQKWKGEPGGVIAECHVNCLVETDAQAYANAEFIAEANPATVLALLDERERNQQYIKHRDQENEDIALTVGKLRVELEAAKSKLNEQREYYEGVIADGSKRIAELEKSEEQLINERDHAESALADMYFAATGDRPEWSNWFGFSDAVDAVVDRIADLEAKQPSPVAPAVLERLRSIVADPRALPRRKEWVSGQQYSYVLLENVEAMVDEACHAAMLQGSQPVSQAYKLNQLSGNSLVIPDAWISCSERMPEKNQNVLISVNFDSSLVEPLICSARYTGSTFRRGEATIKPGNGIEQATHWMPLPEPPQEVNQ